ncbi:MAG: TlpA disulfide reductase family protein [Bryobacteraceae bacterium]|nr:TlpA disulfide reductase family protein [Bryobacteraceae bacterium]
MRSAILASLLSAVSLAAATIPRPVPSMSVPLINGESIQLAGLKGKVVAVEFLLTTCPACQRCSATLNRVYKDLGPKGFQVVGVATNPMAHMLVSDYVKKFGLTFPVGYNENQDQVKEFLQHPVIQIMKVPQLVFIDKQGQIRAQYSGIDEFFVNEEANMRAMVEKLLAEPDPKPAAAGKKTAAAKKK